MSVVDCPFCLPHNSLYYHPFSPRPVSKAPFQILRNRQHPAGRNWRLKAQSSHSTCCQQNLRVQTGEPDHVRLGDSRSTSLRKCLQSRKCPQRELNQQNRAKQSGGEDKDDGPPHAPEYSCIPARHPNPDPSRYHFYSSDQPAPPSTPPADLASA